MIETIAITDATPITMPSAVRKLRNACARIDPNAARTASLAANHSGNVALCRARSRSRLVRGALGLLGIVFDDLAILQTHHTLAVLCDVGLVRYEHDRL